MAAAISTAGSPQAGETEVDDAADGLGLWIVEDIPGSEIAMAEYWFERLVRNLI